MKRLVMAGWLALWTASSPAQTPPQELAAGDIRVEMGRPVRLQLNVSDPPQLWEASSTLVHALAPASPFQGPTSTSVAIEPSIEWNDPLVGARTIRVTSNVAEISVPAGPERTATYSILWKGPDDSFSVRVPAVPRTFKAEIVRAQPAIVVEATGSAEGVLIGDQVAVRVRVAQPGGPRSVHLFHRAMPQGTSSTAPVPYLSAPMECAESGPADSLWTGTIPSPADPRSTIDYYVEIVDRQQRQTTYGTAELPHRIHLKEPGNEGKE